MKSLSPIFFLASAAFGFLPVLGAALTSDDLAGDIAPMIESKTLQVVSAGVIQPGSSATAHAGALGSDNSAAPDDRTLYEIGSISKVFTSLLLAEAVVRGEMTLDTPIALLLPADVALPENAADRITVGMLATHTSGLPKIPIEIPTDDYTDPYAAYAESDLWDSLRTVKLDFEPGAKAGYSNLGAGLLGTLLARKAGVTYSELLATRITSPLGMLDTVIEPDAAQHARFAPPFNSAGQVWSHWDFKALAGGGGIRSTLTDMMRFAAAMLDPASTSLEKSIDLAWTRQDLAETVAPGGQALGWMLAGDNQTRWHNGQTGGYHAAIFVNRELGVASALLANCSNPVGTTIANRLFLRAAGKTVRPIPNRDRADVALTAEQLDRCTGVFRLNANIAITCERRDLSLFATPTGQPPDRLYAASSNTFFSRRAPLELTFEFADENSPATAIAITLGGRQSRAVRELPEWDSMMSEKRRPFWNSVSQKRWRGASGM